MRFGRKKDAGSEEGRQLEPEEALETGEPGQPGEPGRPGEPAETEVRPRRPATSGPYDAADVDYEDDPDRIDLGALVVTAHPGIELRLQVDEPSGTVAAALLVHQEGAVELRAFAAPRNADMWDDVRRSISAEAARQGGTATEVDGPWGQELQVVVSGKDDQGRTVTQPSRIAGITGPRWLLRATFFGKPAVEPDPDHPLERALRDVVVVRGDHAMAPGEFLPLTLPANAQRLG